MATLPASFPFKDRFEQFLAEYANCPTYWYVPKTRTLDDENVQAVKSIMSIVFEEFLGRVWNRETQDELLERLVTSGILTPYKRGGTVTDRTALSRIWKKLLETLGLLWVRDDKEILITDVGLDVIIASDPRSVIEGQVAKLQYPNPSLRGNYRDDFKGILPHLFLVQVLQRCGYQITFDEYELFVNLAQSQEDLERIVSYVDHWRDLNALEKETILGISREIPMRGEPDFGRYRRIRLHASYQRSFYTYPRYLTLAADESQPCIRCTVPAEMDELVAEKLQGLKVTSFKSLEDWFAYFGDPAQQPSWFTYLSLEVERASTREEIKELVEEHKERLTKEEAEEIQKKQIEKGIETFYVDNLALLEAGLTLVENGRQYSTPIGRIDLFCKASDGQYVVIEIKADEAADSVFGQILRYIGWVHRNIDDGNNNVRGMILAARFPEAARYSRIGLLREDYQHFLKFKEHGLYVSDT